MKGCELCERAARMYCESDQASLCWECDAKVHGANFLVARHSRCLLCRSCQAPTPWRASGARLGPTVSVCERCCLQGKQRRQEEDHGGDDDGGFGEEKVEEEDEEDDQVKEDEEEEEAEEEGEGDEEEEDEEEEDEDNQVVPWSLTPPPVASSSSSEESSSQICNGLLKRMRENADLASRDHDIRFSSSQPSYLASAPAPAPSIPARAIADDEATSFPDSSLRPSKDRKKAVSLRSAPSSRAASSIPVHPESTTTTESSAAAILDIRHRGDSRAVDLAPSSSPSPPI